MKTRKHPILNHPVLGYIILPKYYPEIMKIWDERWSRDLTATAEGEADTDQ